MSTPLHAGRKFDIRIDEAQRLNLLSGMEHLALAAKAHGLNTEGMEELYALVGMLNNLEPLVDPDAAHPDNALNDFTA